MIEVDPSVLNFSFYSLAHTRRFFFHQISPKEHLTFRNRRDILTIVTQMALPFVFLTQILRLKLSAIKP